ncbi:MAG: P-type DNA transfer protein VirB5 [Acidiphilium sp.]|nr:P-type DNA transfer protein VirB5 [Acidiphilium sp.]MDD4937152.1 P-type DNA transfer protein VirB5 [Acidiphilium sp.]
MRIKLKSVAAVAALVAAGGFVPPAAFAQIPVTVTSNVPGVIWHAEDIAKFTQEIQQAEAQVQQLQQTYNSLNGSSGIGNLFRNPQLANMLPSNWQNVYDSVANGGYSGITGSVQSILSEEQSVQTGTTDQAQSNIVQQQAQVAAYDKAMGENAYQSTIQRLNDLQGLTDQIDNETSPKQIMDLQARIQGEQAAIQNEQTKVQLMSMLQRAQQGQIDAEKTALEQRILSPNNTAVPSIPGG